MTAEHDASSTHPQVTSEEERFFSLLSDKDRAAIWDRMLKPRKAPPPDLLDGIPTDFDRTFQEIVPAKLLNLITALAPMVQLDVYGFAEACDAVWRVARKYGADYLSEAARHDWLEWVAKELITRIDDPIPEGLVTPERLEVITGER